ncbi:hypothetical protein C2G38_2250342 [Gigaspora rosea]|uniref:Uncharacterized protein n=1 Tax=Gigaspora rosea TaxID=44941 RepID=A0A397ULV6_9GLOM|nr:hypothetical protein C2G38_2250342 [Gigaspora rosea]
MLCSFISCQYYHHMNLGYAFHQHELKVSSNNYISAQIIIPATVAGVVVGVTIGIIVGVVIGVIAGVASSVVAGVAPLDFLLGGAGLVRFFGVGLACFFSIGLARFFGSGLALDMVVVGLVRFFGGGLSLVTLDMWSLACFFGDGLLEHFFDGFLSRFFDGGLSRFFDSGLHVSLVVVFYLVRFFCGDFARFGCLARFFDDVLHVFQWFCLALSHLNLKLNGISNNLENYERVNNLESLTSNDERVNNLESSTNKSFEIGTEIDQETVNSCYDLSESIYRLLDLCKDKLTNTVDKILILQQHLKKLCNKMVPNSFKSISKIQFEQLNFCHVCLIGCYGRNDLISKLLLNKNIIDQVMCVL